MAGLPISLGNGIPIIYRELSAEVILKSGGAGATGSYAFPNDQTLQLNKAKVYAMEAFSATQATKSAGGNNVIPGTAIPGLMLLLHDFNNIDRTFNIPMYTFVSSLNTGYQRMFFPFGFDMVNSKVIITDGTNITAGQSIVFNIIYYTQDDEDDYYAMMADYNSKMVSLNRGM